MASFVRHLCRSERRQLASATYKLHGQEFVSGDIFNGSPGKYVIAEVERMHRSGDSTLLNFQTGRGDFALPFLKDCKIDSQQTRTESIIFIYIIHFFSAFEPACPTFPFMLSTPYFGPHPFLVDMVATWDFHVLERERL